MIPQGWQLLQIGDIGRVVTGNTPATNTSSFYGGGVPFIAPGDLGDFKYVITAEKTLTEQGVAVSRVLPAGATLFTCIGSTIGKIGIAAVRCTTNQQINAVVPNGQADAEFVYYQLAHNADRIAKLAGTQAVPIISKGQFAKEKVLLPPLPEQQRIAEILSTWDSAIETVEALIANARAQKKALMQSLLTGKKRLPGFSGEWMEMAIGDLLREVSRDVEWDDEATYDLISVRRRSEGIFHRESLSGHQILTKSMKVARTGDFLISKMQVVHGASALVRPKFDGFNISGSYIALVPKDSSCLNIEYFDWFSRMPVFRQMAYFSSYGVHIEKMTFSLATFLRQRITLPADVNEQAAIVERLEAAETTIREAQNQAAALREEKSALMQQLLTGKRRVKAQESEVA